MSELGPNASPGAGPPRAPAAPAGGVFSFLTPLVPLAPVALSMIIELGALAWLLAHWGALPHAIAAAAIHVLAVVPVLRRAGTRRTERMLSAALTLTLPLIGAPIAAFMLGTAGRSEIAEAGPAGGAAAAACRIDDLGRMAEGLSCCEALLAAGVEERRAILSALSRQPDRNGVALLRWALGAPDGDLAVDTALALEDVNASFEARLEACRRALAGAPTFDSALAVAETIAAAIEIALVDPPMIPTLAREARDAYAQAGALDPARFEVAAASRARMELAVLRPDLALDVIDGALATASAAMRRELGELRHEALLAAHNLPWEGPSALGTYHHAVPRVSGAPAPGGSSPLPLPGTGTRTEMSDGDAE